MQDGNSCGFIKHSQDTNRKLSHMFDTSPLLRNSMKTVPTSNNVQAIRETVGEDNLSSQKPELTVQDNTSQRPLIVSPLVNASAQPTESNTEMREDNE